MMDIKTLVSAMRHCVETCDCATCSVDIGHGQFCITRLFSAAADAIEELSRENKEIMFRANQLEAMNDALIGETGAADALIVASKPRWIPVTEALPEEDGCYLVAVKNDHQRRYSKTAWFSHDSWFARQDVTHWMPLPTTPWVET